ncbi:MAG: prepilin-type N-terminal cleavage/methylation domain-containing protein, partial [Myxococcota bacterium]
MNRRGFTLVELMAVLSMTSIVAAAAGVLYLEIRTAGVRTEAQVTLERRAALVLEWVSRDLRTAQLRPPKRGEWVRFTQDGQTIVYRSEGDALFRTTQTPSNENRRLLSRYAKALKVAPDDGGFRATVRM